MKDFCQQRSVVAKAPRKNPDNPGDTPREESAKVQGGPGQVFRHSTTLGIGGLSAAKQILGFEFRPVQLRSLNFFYTQCYLYTIQQPHPPTHGNPQVYSPQHNWPQKPLSTNLKPHTDQTACSDHHACVAGREQKSRGEKEGTRFFLERHLPFSLTFRPKGLWHEFPKNPKVKEYLANSLTDQ